ncbi:hypothetical protein PABG_11699 [Paracoccidioides brasiliensis Pb03]|nr:hypothetical protein PABG_11699 [Paracoccidioides brasiliensis Pb03]
MEGPYDWVPPKYRYDNRLGAAFRFESELGPDVGSPELASLKKFLTERKLKSCGQNRTKFCITYPGCQEVLMIERFTTRRCALVMGNPRVWKTT